MTDRDDQIVFVACSWADTNTLTLCTSESMKGNSPLFTVSRASYIAIYEHARAVQSLAKWDRDFPAPPFERGQEVHKVERLGEVAKVDAAADRVVAELARDAGVR